MSLHELKTAAAIRHIIGGRLLFTFHRSASIADWRSSMDAIGSKRWTTCPLASIRNLVKFHLIALPCSHSGVLSEIISFSSLACTSDSSKPEKGPACFRKWCLLKLAEQGIKRGSIAMIAIDPLCCTLIPIF